MHQNRQIRLKSSSHEYLSHRTMTSFTLNIDQSLTSTTDAIVVIIIIEIDFDDGLCE